MVEKKPVDIVGQTLKALKRNKFDVAFVRSRQEALQNVLDRIPHGAIVGAGDSVTLKEIGIFEALKKKGFTVYWPYDEAVPRQERRNIARKALLADVFLSSSNAITMDGKIVNVDATGNRVVGMIFGPKKSIIVVGTNKIVEGLDQAFERVKNIAAPLNAKRIREEHGWELLPCIEVGRCVDCDAENRICNITTIIEKKPRAIDISMIIVGEELGL
jgi:L-lactate utilization protein LutB